MNKKTSRQKFAIASAIGVMTVAFVAEVPTEAASIPFTDVPIQSYYYEPIILLYNQGIIEGRTATQFKPGQEATRAEAALFIANALELDTVNVKDPGFKDVPTSSKYYGAIAALYEKGIIHGKSPTMFDPNGTLTRSHIAKMIVLSFEFEMSSASTTKFTDVNKLQNVNERRYIQTLVQNDITKGTSNTTFSPNNTVTRGQLTTFLHKALLAKGEDFELVDVQ
ncbi:S-layer homology domain-containing protein [Lysinibacillus sp. 54212]|uniref:S-layer homology domain-containing protein n=1 Tax=Lysinibacillus sp. 54212 TaxID=3119829 RepID=UPI002FCBF275